MLEPVEYLWTDTTPKDDFRPDWSMKCDNCGAVSGCPSITDLCGPCHFGEADTTQRRMVGRIKGRNDMTEFETTINNGLPVRVRGTVNECHPREYPGRDYIEDLEVLWLSGAAVQSRPHAGRRPAAIR